MHWTIFRFSLRWRFHFSFRGVSISFAVDGSYSYASRLREWIILMNDTVWQLIVRYSVAPKKILLDDCMTLNPSCDVLHCGINLALSHAQTQQRAIPSFLFLLYFRFDVYVGVVAAPLVQSAETTGGRDSNTHFSRLVIVRRTHQTPDTNTHTHAPFDSITFEHSVMAIPQAIKSIQLDISRRYCSHRRSTPITRTQQLTEWSAVSVNSFGGRRRSRRVM